MKVKQAGVPTVFHVTHWKAGSQWIYRILQEIAQDRIIPPQIEEKQFLNNPLVCGAIYPTVYVTKEQFQSVAVPENYRSFVIIRDLRDTLVSGYFSIRYSHAVIDERLARWRERLEKSSVEEGLLILLDEWLPMSARIQQSWLQAGEQCIRYEDLLVEDYEILEKLLIDQCEIAVSRERLHEVVIANRFENLTGGRQPGEENLLAHERKGIAGDWRNYMTSLLTEEFNKRYGGLLNAGGYGLEYEG